MPVRPKPTASTLWLEQQREREYQQHRKRVQEQKACIDNKPPCTQSLSNKRALMEEERRKRIEGENRRLVANMAVIMERGGGIDNKEPWRSTNAARDAERRRARERQRIAEENRKMLRRLQETKSVYSVEKWEADREVNEEYVARLTRYTYEPSDYQTNYDE
ncbi:Hemingway/CFAP97D1 [Trypanosoma melophagium]|uniref:Hemingway/CFAP97D1 n=1 Tax=Trypanosoma melophagium TaxID=715481 RepID=UPI00351A1C06|nr:Hemingway/CFAP97D1 [Trypanosoma melophagium]